MTDRPPQFGLEPQACPFIALVDDRDRRLDVPDTKHRCYAEPTPQPRAEAHQRAYCLTPAFAACPIFLDWAARAAADPIATRQSAPSPAQLARPSDDRPASRPTDPGQRAWAAPPPWTGEGTLLPRPTPASEQLGAFSEPNDHADQDLELTSGGAASAAALAAARSPGAGLDLTGMDVARAGGSAAAGAGAAGAGAAGTGAAGAAAAGAAGAIGAGAAGAVGAGASGVGGASAAPGPEAEVPGFLAGRSVDRSPDRSPGIMPDHDAEVWPATPTRPISPGLDALASPRETEQPTPAASPRYSSQAKLAPAKRLDTNAEWAGTRRSATPMLRTRLGMQKTSTVIMAVIGVLITLVMLSVLAGAQGGGGGNGPDPSRGHSGSPSPAASPTATPTPSPSPATYTVKGGDSLFTIAKKYGLTVEQIACYNGITDPNRLDIGQVLNIPPDAYNCPGSSQSPSESPAAT